MGDFPVEEFHWKTPLQVAHHPNMDLIAERGKCGLLKTIPDGTPKGSDTANLSLLGYDPRQLNVSRGPLEAASLGVKLDEDDIAIRCNLITEETGVLRDYSAGHIDSLEAKELIELVNDEFGVQGEIEFYNGVSYRHTLVLRGKKYSTQIRCSPPHDVMGSPISDILVKPLSEEGKATAALLNDIIINSKKILTNHKINQKRLKNGEAVANMIWFWGAGRKPTMPTLWEKFRIQGAVISAVDLIKGIGHFAGMDVIDVPGATGLYDTNYEGKADYALNSLNYHDLVYVHVEAPDEAGHTGDFELKVKTIEDLDRRLIGRILRNIKEDYVISIVTDHFTPIKLRTHTTDPTPFAIHDSTEKEADNVKRFDESSVKNGSYGLVEGHNFMSLVLKR